MRFLVPFVLLTAALAQQPQSPPVRYTVAASHTFQAEVELPGTIEAPLLSTVAGEIEGLVEEFKVREGDSVKKGQLLAKLRTKQLELQKANLEAQLVESVARQKLAERDFKRAQELFDAQVIAQEELDAKQFEFDAWEGRDAQLKAQIARIEDSIASAGIYAPFDGVVVSEGTQVGEWLGKGDPVVDLMSTSELEVRVDVPESYYQRFRVGSRVPIAFEALDGRRTIGVVRAVIPQADTAARTFPVKVSINGQGLNVAPGMIAAAVFPGGRRATRTIVPKDALVLRGAQQNVFVITEEGTVRPVPVRAGLGVGQWVAVDGPVKPGDKVVTRGNERLRPGQPVSGQLLEYKLP